jgi:hypothetical protein
VKNAIYTTKLPLSSNFLPHPFNTTSPISIAGSWHSLVVPQSKRFKLPTWVSKPDGTIEDGGVDIELWAGRSLPDALNVGTVGDLGVYLDGDCKKLSVLRVLCGFVNCVSLGVADSSSLNKWLIEEHDKGVTPVRRVHSPAENVHCNRRLG